MPVTRGMMHHPSAKHTNAYNASSKGRAAYRKSKYGEGAPEHLEAQLKAQDNLCAICGCHLTSPHLDHNHDTDQLRGALCRQCNAGLGNFREVPELLQSASDYLRKWQ